MLTLDELKKRPLYRLVDRSQDNVEKVSIPWYQLSDYLPTPEGYAGVGIFKMDKLRDARIGALEFYLCQEIMAEVEARYTRFELLPAGVSQLANNCVDTMSLLAIRVFWYLLFITHRESRHAKPSSLNKEFLNLIDNPVTDDPEFLEIVDYMFAATNKISSDSFASGYATLAHGFKIGLYTSYLERLYTDGLWSKSFGGDSWALITSVLKDFLYGRISANTLCDTAWALAHNTGPIFNKGLLFFMNSKKALVEVLDVQRAGMIGSYIQEFPPEGCPKLNSIFDWARGVLDGYDPPSIVDWDKVMALGAVGSYHDKQNKQLPGNYITVFPNFSVPTLLREEV